MPAKFSLGKIVATPAAIDALVQSNEIPSTFLARHASGDWGDLESADNRANDRAIAHEGDLDQQDRMVSSYRTGNGTKIWIITEWDRSVTTILLPDEY